MKSLFKSSHSVNRISILSGILSLWALIFSVHTAQAFETNFPQLGEASMSSRLDAHSEQVIGNMIMQKIHGSGFFISDAVVNEYLKNLAAKFSTETRIPNFTLDFFGVNSSEFNAFAFFGSHVAVHSGLILAVDNESELAAVLAHETAHITQRHLTRMLQHNQKMMPLTYAEILAAIAIGALGSPEAAAHLATAAMAGHVQQVINYTRDHEQEADRIGIQLLARTQFDPSAMASVFQRMKQHSIYQEMPPEYLLTHPMFDSRIADAQNRAASLAYRQIPDSLFFHFVRARLEIEKEENAHKKLNRLKENLISDRYQNKAAAQYAYALALMNNRQPQEALPILRDLNARYPEEWIIDLSVVDAEAKTGHMAPALLRIKQLLEAKPKNYAIRLQYATLLLQQKQAQQVIKLLLPYRKVHFTDPAIHQMLAHAYSMSQQPIKLHHSQAEWHFAKGEFKEAYKQLDLALEYAEHHPMESQKINDRREAIKEIEEQQRDLKL